MTKILVTAISGDVANSILKSLKTFYPAQALIGCDIYKYPIGFNKVTQFYQVSPCANEQLYLSQLLEICNRESIGLLIPTNEFEILCISKNRQIFAEHGIQLMLLSQEIYDIFFNKYLTQKKIEELHLTSIPTYFGDEYVDQLKFPIIVKDVFSCGSKNITIVRNQEELCKLGQLKHSQIVQSYIGDLEHEYTVPVFSKDGGKNIFCIPFRRTLSKAGYTNFIEPVDKKEYQKIFEICSFVAQAINLVGSIDLQMRAYNNEFYIFECNPRLSGTVNFRHKLGFLDAIWWSEMLLNHDVCPTFSYPTNFVGVRELNEEIFWK